MEFTSVHWHMCVYVIFYCSFILSTTCTKDKRVTKIKPGTPEYLQTLVNSDKETGNLSLTYNKLDNVKVEDSIDMHKNTMSRLSVPDPGLNSFLPISQQDIADRCIKVPKCNEEAKYRTINGSCNNLLFPMWAMAGTALVRLVRATYTDGLNEPRKSVTGLPLPTPGELRSLFPDRNVPDRVNVLNMMEWGQVVSHDTSHIINQNSDKGTGLMCCNRGKLPSNPSSEPKPCMPIEIPVDDPFYSQFGQTCLNFVRSSTTTNFGCNLFPQQQVATVSHFVDASFVYGSFDDVATSLRTFSGGKLRTQVTPDNRHFPPNSEKARQECDNRSPKDACYLAGDDRVNLNPTIAVHQIIFLREHNQLCDQLHALNPHWDDETLYQEARRIVVAITQHITYKDFLPILLGEEFLRKIKLLDGDEDQDLSTTEYDVFLNPSTVNGFTTAAYRSFHSMIPGTMSLVSDQFEELDVLKLENFFFRPHIVHVAGNLDKFLRGLAFQAAQVLDSFFTSSITNFLFKSNRRFGTDLGSIDIQRGRDHGLAPYNDFRAACGLSKAKDFNDLSDAMTKEAIQKLQSKYKSVDDVDFFVGGMMETLVPNTLVGPTFQCIIGEQFKRWRNGDRFYYEFGGFPGSFTKSQVIEIRKITLAAIFCRNGDNIGKIQTNIFNHPTTENRIVPCSQISQMNLEPWRT